MHNFFEIWYRIKFGLWIYIFWCGWSERTFTKNIQLRPSGVFVTYVIWFFAKASKLEHLLLEDFLFPSFCSINIYSVNTYIIYHFNGTLETSLMSFNKIEHPKLWLFVCSRYLQVSTIMGVKVCFQYEKKKLSKQLDIQVCSYEIKSDFTLSQCDIRFKFKYL